MATLRLDNGKRAFEVERNGETFKWEYDVVEIKLLAEQLEKKHKMRTAGSDQIERATPGFMQDFSKALDQKGLTGCTPDAAFQVHQIVNTQFIRLAHATNEQVNAILEG